MKLTKKANLSIYLSIYLPTYLSVYIFMKDNIRWKDRKMYRMII